MRYFGRKLIKSISLAVAILLIVAMPVLAAVFEASLLVQESSGNSYDMIGIRTSARVSWWATNGYIDADGRDTRVYHGSTEQPHMLQDDNVFLADDLGAYASNTYTFATGETPQDMYIIPGYDGYWYTTDAAALEPANDFEFEFNSYVDTSIANKYLLSKSQACGIGITDVQDVTGWIYAANAGEASGGVLFGGDNIYGANWQAQTFTPAADYAVTKVRIWLSLGAGAPVGDFTVGIWATAAGAPTGSNLGSVTVNANTLGAGANDFYLDSAVPVTNGTVYAVVAYHPTGTVANYWAWQNDNANPYAGGAAYTSTDSGDTWAATGANIDNLFAIFQTTWYVTASGIVADEYIVNFAADPVGNTLTITVTDKSTPPVVVTNSIALGAATVPNNANDWYFNGRNGIPYTADYQHTVTGALIVHYAPDDIISGTTLPDLAGAVQNGTFVFGSNPSGISISLSSFDIVDVPTDSGLILTTPDSVDILLSPDNMMMEDFEMRMTGNEFYFLINWLSGISNLDVPMIWWYLSAAGCICALALVHKYIRNIYASGFTSAAIGWFVVSMSGLEWWMPVPIVFATMFIGMWKRSAEV